MSSIPRISAVVCTYRRYDLLEAALQSLRRQSIPVDRYSIIVVDNSPDAAQAQTYLDRYDRIDNIRYIHTPTSGLSNARNIAARECRTEFVAYLDDDAIASPDWLEKLLDAFDKFGERAGVVGGPILPIWQDERPAWLADELVGALSIVDWGGSLRIAGEHEWIAGANIAFRTAPLLDAGAFSTLLGRNGAGGALLSNEENEVIAKLRAAGFDAIWAAGARVRHLVHRDRLRQGWFRRRWAWQAVSDFLCRDSADGLEPDGYWQGLTRYFSSLSPRLRTPRGLFVEVADPDDFARQVNANYNLTMLLLLGHHVAEADLQSGPGADAGRP